MHSRNRITLYRLLCLVVLCAAFALRAYKLEALRQTAFDLDERAVLLMGTSLLREGTPSSWSIFYPLYKGLGKSTVIRTYGNLELAEVRPFLDHQPLFALLMGSWALLTKNAGPQSYDWATLRFPMLAMAMSTIVATMMIAQKLLGKSAALFVTAAFAFFPSHVLASRFIVDDNVTALALMISLLAYILWDSAEAKSSPIRKYAAAIMLCVCAGALLIKLSTIIVPATLALLALLHKQRRLLTAITMATTISILLLFTYATIYDWGLFWSVIHAYEGMSHSAWHFWTIFTQLDIGKNISVPDPSIIVGFIGLIMLIADQNIPWRKRRYILAPLIVLSLFLIFLAPAIVMGWYKYPLYPLIAVGLGYMLHKAYEGKRAYFLLLLPLTAAIAEHTQQVTLTQMRFVFISLYGTLVLALTMRNKTHQRLLSKALLITTTSLLFLADTIWIYKILHNAG